MWDPRNDHYLLGSDFAFQVLIGSIYLQTNRIWFLILYIDRWQHRTPAEHFKVTRWPSVLRGKFFPSSPQLMSQQHDQICLTGEKPWEVKCWLRVPVWWVADLSWNPALLTPQYPGLHCLPWYPGHAHYQRCLWCYGLWANFSSHKGEVFQAWRNCL